MRRSVPECLPALDSLREKIEGRFAHTQNPVLSDPVGTALALNRQIVLSNIVRALTTADRQDPPSLTQTRAALPGPAAP